MFRIASSDGDDSSACACDRPPRCGCPRARAGQGDAHAQGAASAREAERSLSTREGIVRTQEQAGRIAAARDRQLREGLHRRGCGTPHRRCDVAGDAPVTQSQLGPPAPHCARRAGRPAASADQRLAGPSRRRHGAAARRTDADGPCLSPGRARRGYLAHPDAARSSRPRRARGDVRNEHGPRRPARHQPGRLDARSTPPFCARSRRNPKSLACSRTPQSSGRFAGRLAATAHGSEKSGRPSATTITFTSASPVRRGNRAATTRARPPPATAAAKSSTTGLPLGCFSRSPAGRGRR